MINDLSSEKTKKSIKIDLNASIENSQNPEIKQIDLNLEKEIPHSAKKDKYYLPVLYVNDASMWPSIPVSERSHWTDDKARDTCLGNCCNVEGLKAACCQLDPDNIEHVLGPIDDEDIKKIISRFKKSGMHLNRSDIVIDFEEGKMIGERFFNGHEVFKNPKSYPIMRIQAYGPRFCCKFLNPASGKCSIYDARPKMCASYLCEYVKGNFLIRTNKEGNTYGKVR